MYFCYFVIICPWKRAGPFIWINLNPLHPRMLCAKFGWNWLWRRRWKYEKFTDRQTDRQTPDDRWSEKLTWAFSSGELKKKTSPLHFIELYGIRHHWDYYYIVACVSSWIYNVHFTRKSVIRTDKTSISSIFCLGYRMNCVVKQDDFKYRLQFFFIDGHRY